MRKLAILATVAVLAMAGCGKGSTDKGNTESSTDYSAAEAPQNDQHQAKTANEGKMPEPITADPSLALINTVQDYVDCGFINSMYQSMVKNDQEMAKKVGNAWTNVGLEFAESKGIDKTQFSDILEARRSYWSTWIEKLSDDLPVLKGEVTATLNDYNSRTCMKITTSF